MFSFEITTLGNLFFGLSAIVFVTLIFLKKENFILITLLLASLGAIFYANDMIALFIGWEVMSWSSYFIISRSVQPKTAQKYIIFNLGAGFALLGAIIFIYSFSGSFLYSDIDFSQIPLSSRAPIYIMLLITIFVKSGVVPFHYWVVDTYSQSDDIFSAFLSAVISKAGIFLFILFFYQIIGFQNIEPVMMDIVAWLGVITSIVATFKAISQDDPKRLLAYSSIGQVGYIVTILTVMNSSGLEAGLYHTIIHAFVALLLFVNVASIIYITGKRKFNELGGLIYEYPVLFVMLLIGIIALAGMPPLGGFSSKFLIYTALLEEKKALLLVAIMFSSASAFLYCYKLIYGIYLGQSPYGKQEHKKLPALYYIPQYISALVVIVLGFMPSLAIQIFNPVLIALGFEPTKYSSLFELNSKFASFNGGVIMAVFGAIFVVILLIIMTRKSKAVKVRDKYDISYCGEIPAPTSNLHYGHGMGHELKRISFIGYILKNSISPYWESVASMARDSSTLIRKLYGLTIQNMGVLIIILFTILLFIGVQ